MNSPVKATFPKIFGKAIVELGKKDPSLFLMTPAMIEGSSLKEFFQNFPTRSIDVGIAEGHCLTFAGGVAFQKKLPVIVSIYSTFLQRAFDNLFHDICLQNAPVILAIDRAGLSGPDGVTHHGIFDLAFLQTMPNLTIAQPRNGRLLKELLESAHKCKAPFAIRYPNRETDEESHLPLQERAIGKAEWLQKGEKILIIALGHMVETAFDVQKKLLHEDIHISIIDPIFIKPLDKTLLLDAISSHDLTITLEEHALLGGFGSTICQLCCQEGISHQKILNLALPDQWIQHGSNRELLCESGLDAETISQKIRSWLDLNQGRNAHDHSSLSQ